MRPYNTKTKNGSEKAATRRHATERFPLTAWQKDEAMSYATTTTVVSLFFLPYLLPFVDKADIRETRFGTALRDGLTRRDGALFCILFLVLPNFAVATTAPTTEVEANRGLKTCTPRRFTSKRDHIISRAANIDIRGERQANSRHA